MKPTTDPITQPAVTAPCNECPWRRDAQPGRLGPYDPEWWCLIAHADGAIACHKTIRNVDPKGNGSWDDPAIRQCRGAAIFRANVGKRSRNPTVAWGPPDAEMVFSSNEEFIAHHTESRTEIEMETPTTLAELREALRENLEELRANPITAEFLDSLTTEQLHELEGDLLLLQQVTRDVRAQIEEHYNV